MRNVISTIAINKIQIGMFSFSKCMNGMNYCKTMCSVLVSAVVIIVVAAAVGY